MAATPPSGTGSRAWVLRMLGRLLRGLAWVLGLAVIVLWPRWRAARP